MWHSRQASATTFPHISRLTKGDDCAKTVPNGVVSDGHVRAFFVPLPPRSVDRIHPGSKHFVGSGSWPNFVSQCCVCRVSLTVPKHLDSCSTFHKAVVTSRAFRSHFVSWFYVLDPPQAPTPNVESVSPGKRLLFPGGVFLDALLYYQ